MFREGTLVLGEDRARRWDLVVPHRDRLLAIAKRLVRDPGDAEDCVQEAMARCVSFERLDEDNVVGFLVTTTRRLCIDHHRRNAHDGRVAARLTGMDRGDASPEDAVCDRAEAEWVAARLADLPGRQRDAVLARADGQSPAEIAATLSVSYKTVETLLYRVRVRVRAELQRAYGVALLAVRRPRNGWVTAGVASVAIVTTATFQLTPRHGAPPVRAAAPPEVELREHGVAPAANVVALPSPVLTVVPSPPVPLPTPTPSHHVTVSHGRPARCPAPPYMADPCVSPDPTETPGSYLLDCLLYGIDYSLGFECRHSPTPTPEGDKR